MYQVYQQKLGKIVTPLNNRKLNIGQFRIKQNAKTEENIHEI